MNYYYTTTFVIFFLKLLILKEIYGQVGVPPKERASFKLAQSKDCGKISEIKGDIRTRIPWTVAIYYRSNSLAEYKFLLSGALLGNSTVVTVGGGPFGSLPRGFPGSKYHIPPRENFLIVAGLNTTNLNSKDQFTQFANVSYILPSFEHNPDQDRQFHYIIYHLETQFNLKTPYARAICLPFLLRRVKASPFRWQYLQSGFSLPSGPDKSLILRSFNVSGQSEDECQSAFKYYYHQTNNNAFCSRLTPGLNQGDGCHLHGSIAAIAMTNRFFIMGLVSLVPSRRRRTCNSRTLHFYGKTIDYIDWMYRNYQCGSKSFSCSDGKCIPLEHVCNGRFDCPDESDENDLYCASINQCPGDQRPCGLNGPCTDKKEPCQLEFETVKSQDIVQKKNCPSLNKNQGQIQTCFNSETKELINCTQNSHLPGTVGKLQCNYYNSPSFHLKSVEMKCGSDGKWKNKLPFFCQPDCGVVKNSSQKLSFPWHALIFQLDQNEYTPICSATLIENEFLLSSADCPLFKEVAGNQQKAGNFKIVISPSSANYAENLQDPVAQQLNIRTVLFAPESDIGLIQLSNSIKSGGYVRPVCYLNHQNSKLPIPGKIGQISGFFSLKSKLLKYVDIKVLDLKKNQCTGSGTFCAQLVNNTYNLNIKGAGLVFESNGRYILKGIAKTQSVFTHLDTYADWILEILEITTPSTSE